MNALQRTAAVLIWPAIAWLGAACDRVDMPTEPGPSGLVTAVAATCNVPSTTHPTIQSAVSDPTCTTIIVAPGTYNESVLIPRPLTLNGPNVGTSWDGSRGDEAFVNSLGITFLLESQDVTIDGFTITGNLAIYVSGSNTGTVIQNNIITGVSRSLTLDATLATSASNNVSVLDNHLISDVRSFHVDGRYTNMKVNENQFSGAAVVAGIFFFGAPGHSIAGFEFKDNVVLHPANMASNISNAMVSGNTFNPVSPGDEALLISLQNSTVTYNTFEGDDNIACLRLFGNEGVATSHHVLISVNTFSDCGRVLGPTPSSNYAIQLGPDVHHIDIKNNEIDDGVEGVNTADGTPWDVTQEIHINFNNITGNTAFGVRNGQMGILDAECNWWGAANGPGPVGPGSGDRVSDNVDFTPWLTARAPGGACAGGFPSGGTVNGGGQINVDGGKASFGFSANDTRERGHLNYMNHDTGDHLNCTVDVVMITGETEAHLEGTCSSKSDAPSFEADVEDNGKPGKNTDKFTITYNGTTEGGLLRSGNIQIH